MRISKQLKFPNKSSCSHISGHCRNITITVNCACRLTFGDNRDTVSLCRELIQGNTQCRITLPIRIVEYVYAFVYFGGVESRKCRTYRWYYPYLSGDFERYNQMLRILCCLFQKDFPQQKINNHRKPARVCWTFGDGRDNLSINLSENYTVYMLFRIAMCHSRVAYLKYA